MFNYTHNNHCKYGYNNVWFVNRFSESDIFMCEFGQIEKELSFRESNKLAAELISASTNKPIRLMLSNGGDSQIMARAFIDANVKFSVAIMRYFSNSICLNDHDINSAIQFCKKNNIEIKYYDLHIDRYRFNFDYSEYLTSQCSNIHLYPHMWLMLEIMNDGHLPVCGEGDPYLYENNGEMIFQEREDLFCRYKLFINNMYEGIPSFYHYLPEQMYSFLMHDESRCVTKDNLESKQKLYSSCYPDYASRTKRTGTELLKIKQQEVSEVTKYCTDSILIPYNKLLCSLKNSNNS